MFYRIARLILSAFVFFGLGFLAIEETGIGFVTVVWWSYSAIVGTIFADFFDDLKDRIQQ